LAYTLFPTRSRSARLIKPSMRMNLRDAEVEKAVRGIGAAPVGVASKFIASD
jgi:hypothetical protein